MYCQSMQAQVCTPDTSNTAPGIYPDSATGLAADTVGIPYQQIITVNVPPDTTDPNCCTVTIDSMQLTNINNLPPGLSYACDVSSCTWAGGTTGCVLISGTVTNPADTGLYDIQASITAYVTCGVIIAACAPLATTQSADVNYYSINVEPAFLMTTSVADASCSSTCDGSSTVTVTGGTGPYTYDWGTSPSQTNASATGLCVGNYKVSVTNAYGIIDSLSVAISSPPALTLSMSTINASCGNSDGSSVVTVGGGTAPYSYLWNDSLAQITDTASNLSSGSYTVIITDSNGCMDSATASISDAGAPTVSTTLQSMPSCFGGCNGSASVSATGGSSPYTYSWNTTPVQTDTLADNLCAGTYSATVTDSLGCIAISNISITEPPQIVVSGVSTDVSCNGFTDGTIVITASGGTGSLTYSIDSGTTYFSPSTFAALSAGSYGIMVQDQSGYVVAGSTLTINEPAALSGTMSSTIEASPGASDGTATVTPAGGTIPYTYSWNTTPTAQTDSTAVGLATGIYTVIVTDMNGCAFTDSVSVGVGVGLAEWMEYMKVHLYPNPARGELYLELEYDDPIEMHIFDILGKSVKVISIHNSRTLISVDELRDGLYIYQLVSTKNGVVCRNKFSIYK